MRKYLSITQHLLYLAVALLVFYSTHIFASAADEAGIPFTTTTIQVGQKITRTFPKIEGKNWRASGRTDHLMLTIPEDGFYHIDLKLDTWWKTARFFIQYQEDIDAFYPNNSWKNIGEGFGLEGMERMLYKAGTYKIELTTSCDELTYTLRVDRDELPKMKVTKVKAIKNNKIQLDMTCPGNNYYDFQVQYSTDKQFSKNVKTVFVDNRKFRYKKSKVSVLIKKPKKGKTYYFRVRQIYGHPKSSRFSSKHYTGRETNYYKMLSKDIKVYSKWSNIKKMKVK